MLWGAQVYRPGKRKYLFFVQDMIELFVPGKSIITVYNTSNFKGRGKGFFAFPNTGRSLGPTQPPVEWVTESFTGGKAIGGR
jgi:hypothetical protein